jgi:Uma2 family endonuclease
MPISEATYLRVIEEDPERKWELRCGELREKEPMTWAHESIAWRLGFRLQQQLDFDAFEVRVNAGRVRRSEERYYIPDVMVIPKDVARRLFSDPNAVVILPEPLPFIAEVWAPSAGRSDVREKLPDYRQRGDAEVWLIHPIDKVVRIWRRQPDGRYAESVTRGGSVQLAALSSVSIDLDELLALAGPT